MRRNPSHMAEIDGEFEEANCEVEIGVDHLREIKITSILMTGNESCQNSP